MSKNEELFENFLQKNNIQYKKQYIVNDCPFNFSKKHKVDFYLPENNLYIEIKGFMTICQIYMLIYLQNRCNLYVLQMTEENWIIPYNKQLHHSINNKIQLNIEKQFEEIRSLNTKELCEISKKRIENYLKYYKELLKSWLTEKD